MGLHLHHSPVEPLCQGEGKFTRGQGVSILTHYRVKTTTPKFSFLVPPRKSFVINNLGGRGGELEYLYIYIK